MQLRDDEVGLLNNVKHVQSRKSCLKLNSALKGLFISRDTCSDIIAQPFRVCFCGVSHNYRAICCKMGYRKDVSV